MSLPDAGITRGPAARPGTGALPTADPSHGAQARPEDGTLRTPSAGRAPNERVDDLANEAAVEMGGVGEALDARLEDGDAVTLGSATTPWLGRATEMSAHVTRAHPSSDPGIRKDAVVTAPVALLERLPGQQHPASCDARPHADSILSSACCTTASPESASADTLQLPASSAVLRDPGSIGVSSIVTGTTGARVAPPVIAITPSAASIRVPMDRTSLPAAAATPVAADTAVPAATPVAVLSLVAASTPGAADTPVTVATAVPAAVPVPTTVPVAAGTPVAAAVPVPTAVPVASVAPIDVAPSIPVATQVPTPAPVSAAVSVPAAVPVASPAPVAVASSVPAATSGAAAMPVGAAAPVATVPLVAAPTLGNADPPVAVAPSVAAASLGATATPVIAAPPPSGASPVAIGSEMAPTTISSQPSRPAHATPTRTGAGYPSVVAASMSTSDVLPSSSFASLPWRVAAAPVDGMMLPGREVGAFVSAGGLPVAASVPSGADLRQPGDAASAIAPGSSSIVRRVAVGEGTPLPTSSSLFDDGLQTDEDVDFSEITPVPYESQEPSGSWTAPGVAQRPTEELGVGSARAPFTSSPAVVPLVGGVTGRQREVVRGDQEGGAHDSYPGAVSGTAIAPEGAADENPRDGVYELSETTQQQISTLLRTLFAVQTSSDKSIMAFLGIAHYLLAYSHLVGVSSRAARSKFGDSLYVAFEKPVSMKFFMEDAFQCGRHGLHVGGRIRATRHVAGQPAGFREDVLRGSINDSNAASQWLCRRLILRTHVDIQRGVRSLPGGLSRADRDLIATSVTTEGVCSILRERGCFVKFTKTGDVKKPLSITFQWDIKSTWLAGGAEATLVAELRSVLLTRTPPEHIDRVDVYKKKAVRPGVKRPKVGEAVVQAERAGKRPKTSQLAPPDISVGGSCVSDDDAVDNDRVKAPQVITSVLEHWSADVAPSNELPRGGHVLALTLPMHMDAGPGGRPYVDFFFNKVITPGAAGPPFKYVLTFECSKRAPEVMSGVDGASFGMANGQGEATFGQSYDVLRSVRQYVSERHRPNQASTLGPSGPVNDERTGSGLRLHVRSMPRPVALFERVDIVSDYELSSQPELVTRCPGRMIIFLEGMDPVPVTGTFTL